MKDHIYSLIHIDPYLTSIINGKNIVNPLSDLSRLYTQFKTIVILNGKSIIGSMSKLNTIEIHHSLYIILYTNTRTGNPLYNSEIYNSEIFLVQCKLFNKWFMRAARPQLLIQLKR